MRQLNRKHWPYIVVIDTDRIDETDKIDEWCTNAIGLQSLDWYSYSSSLWQHLYAFKNEESLCVFKLRWKCKE